MTKEELDLAEKALYEEYYKKKLSLRMKYAEINRKYEVGDILEDHFHILKVEAIGYYLSGDIPQVLYKGTELKKNLTPAKKQNNTGMYESNIKAKL